MIYLSEYVPVMGPQDREREHKLGRELLSFGLIRDYGRDYAVEQDGINKPVLKGENLKEGNPSLEAGIQFSISHTRGLVVCGISSENIGVDTEYVRPYGERLMKRVCTEDEIAYIRKNKEKEAERFFRLWTLKESYLKATGKGISVPMRDISFSMEEGGKFIRGNMPGWEFCQFVFGNRFIVSVCHEVVCAQ